MRFGYNHFLTCSNILFQNFTDPNKRCHISMECLTSCNPDHAGLSSLHSSTSSDDGNNTVVNSTVGNSSKDGGVTGIAEDGDFGTLV